jgi:hypothetical protein
MKWFPKILAMTIFPNTLLFLLLVSGNGWAQQALPRTFSTTGNLGRGDTGTADTYGMDALFYNPAGLGSSGELIEDIVVASPQLTVSEELSDFSRNPSKYTQLKLSAEEALEKYNRKNLNVDAQNFTGAVLDKLSYGFVNKAYADVTTDLNLLDLDHSLFNAETVAINGVIIGGSREIYDHLRLGVNVKALNKLDAYTKVTPHALIEQIAIRKDVEIKELLVTTRGNGVGYDVGMLWEIPGRFTDATVGVAVFDAGDTTFKGTEARPRPELQKVNIGTAVKTQIEGQTFTGTFDVNDVFYNDQTSIFNHIHMGLRCSYQTYVSVEVGLNQGYGTAGLLLHLKFLVLEYAKFTEELGKNPGDIPDIRDSIQARIGWTL